MNKKQKKFTIAAVVIVLSLGYMMYSSISETGRYFLDVDKLIADKNIYYDKGLKVAGIVVKGSVTRDAMNLKLDFAIEDKKNPESKIKIKYKGVIPDLFDAGREVVVEGKYAKDDIFYATTLLTSCPSKYEEEEEKVKAIKGAKK